MWDILLGKIEFIMALTISTSTSSLQSQKQLNASNRALEKNVATLSSGRRINSAQDDAAGLAIVMQSQSDISTLKQASTNLVQGSALLQTADGGLQQAGNILNRMKELATQATSGSVDATGRAAINSEYQSLKTELDGLSTSTTFNGQKVLDGSYNNNFQAGTSATDTINADLSTVNVSASGLGLTPAAGANANALLTSTSAQATSAELDTAINNLSSYRSQVGAIQSSFTTRSDVVDTESQSLQEAQSAIQDADIAKSQTDFTNSKLLSELSIAASAQGNRMSSSLLKLVR